MVDQQSAIEVVHAVVPGRLRVRVGRIAGDAALARALEQRFGKVAGVREASGNVRTATVLVLGDPNRDPESLLAELEAALVELLGESRAAPAHPTLVSTLPLREATLSDVVGAIGRLASKLVPAPERSSSAGGPSAGSQGLASHAVRDEVNATLWHALPIADLLARLRSGVGGIEEVEVARRLAEFGPNALPAPKVRSKLGIFVTQFQTVPVAMLGVSALLSAATGGLPDAVAILAVVLANASIGYVTESNAERIISSLGRTATVDVEVVRGGVRRFVPATSVVPGDVLVLGAGVFVAADARLIEADGLVIDESSLTGESVPVHKSARALTDPRIPLADRVNMAYRGTLVTGGSGAAVVIAIGLSTQIGQVQSLVGSVMQRETPLQLQLSKLGLQLAIVAGSVCAGVLGIGLARGYPPLQILGTSISLAVAAIPEGLPTVAITTLALGIRRLAERRVLVRQLNAVETLGSIQVMCLDKTGTITVNRMTAMAAQAGLRRLDVASRRSASQEPNGAIDSLDLDALLQVAVLCSEVEVNVQDGVNVLRGSPTESALVQLALEAGVDVREVRAAHGLLGTQYRSETRSFMATLHEPREISSGWEWTAALSEPAEPSELVVSVKGRSPEVLGMCRFYLQDGAVHELGDAERLSIETEGERMAGQALRVLGFAAARWPRRRIQEQAFTLEGETDLVWLGLVGMSDPPREGMRDVLQRFHDAGVRTVMITGDQSATAYAIGKAVGLNSNGQLEILDANQLDGMPPELLRSLVQRVHIFSRVSPAHKLQIVRAFQAAGYTVAMTGDGINDSPALKAADVGVAMGGSGSSAAREVADVILEEDDLSTMVGGIEQGRAIYDDIKKAVHFILSTNLSEILLTVAGITVGAGQTLSPMQLLWINLMTDIFPELALAVQPPEADVLRRPPRDPARPMFDRNDLARIALEGSVLTAGPLLAYAYGRGRYGIGPRSNTLAFTVLAVAQLLHAISARSERHTIFDAESLAPNKYIPMALGGGLLLQLLATLTPGLRGILGTAPLGLLDWAVVGAASAGPLLVNEGVKLARREAEPRALPAALGAAEEVVPMASTDSVTR